MQQTAYSQLYINEYINITPLPCIWMELPFMVSFPHHQDRVNTYCNGFSANKKGLVIHINWILYRIWMHISLAVSRTCVCFAIQSLCNVSLLNPATVIETVPPDHEMSWIRVSQAQQGAIPLIPCMPSLQDTSFSHHTSNHTVTLSLSHSLSVANLMLCCFFLPSKSLSKWLTLMNACKGYAAGRIRLQAKLGGREGGRDEGIRGRNRGRDSL